VVKWLLNLIDPPKTKLVICLGCMGDGTIYIDKDTEDQKSPFAGFISNYEKVKCPRCDSIGKEYI